MASKCLTDYTENFFKKLLRRKYIDFSRVCETKLERCLSTFDLTALGIGSTLGAGIYVVAGQVARTVAGPSVILSFLIAALASVLAGLCYAEFGARVPKTGSAYVYSYVAVGELWAFIIGWNLILEYVIGTASVARAWSGYFDSLVNNSIKTAFLEHMPMNLPGLAPYPDFFAFGITLFLSIILSVGVKESSRFNNIFTGLNLIVVAYIIICGFFKMEFSNWTIAADRVPPSTNPKNPDANGNGGFFPFGFSGTMAGAATCFYAFIGFDVIATTGEEVKNPQKAIPLGIVFSLCACFLAYFGLSAILTLMCPYYLLDTNAPLPQVFERAGWGIAKYIIAIGAVCGLSTSLLGAMFPLPRVIYAMSSDGVLFRFLAKVNERFKTPMLATILSGLFAGTMAAVFDLMALVDMMSIGTLLAYTIVAVCVLILRYRPTPVSLNAPSSHSSGSDIEDKRDDGIVMSDDAADVNGLSISSDRKKSSQSLHLEQVDEIYSTDPIYKKKPTASVYTHSEIITQIIRPPNTGGVATELSGMLVSGCVLTLTVVILFLDAVLIFLKDQLTLMVGWALFLVILPCILIIFLIVTISRQPQNVKDLKFKVPLVPILPCISVAVNTYLMMKLSPETWVRFAVWMFVGFVIYFAYGIRHSSEGKYLAHDVIPAIEDAHLLSDMTVKSNEEDSPASSAGNIDIEGQESALS
ncbi:high affinity cationic amino acid transporter 1-like [Lineus longissimus]|uniref:high affinity cationic amino acid transporter 1-like n=1 Tax=Lineus longissimus TaxID=88925 RepID=UPI002B4E607F